MNKKAFQAFWDKHYPDMLPINYLLKLQLKHRWLRIHSLPDAKRYAETTEEWNILLERQNTLFKNLMESNKQILIVSGIYSNTEKAFDKAIFNDLPYFKTLNFKDLAPIDMHKISTDWADEGVKFTPCFVAENYAPNGFDTILKSIANDEWRLFFLIPDNKRIIAPYDGGVDIIFENESALSFYKIKYKDWLSKREDGL